MDILIIFIVYIFGCILSFGRQVAFWYEEDENNVAWGLMKLWTGRKSTIITNSLLSWFGFVVSFDKGVGKYWFKFGGYNELIKRQLKIKGK